MENILIEELKKEIQSLKNENIDLKKQQIEISKAKELYLGILEEFPALIWRANTEKLCDYFNTTWLQFTGRTMEEEYGYGWAEGVHPDDFDRCVEIFNLNFDQRKSFSMEYRLKNVDQEYHWILDIGRPYYDLDGTFLGYIGSCYDITKQKNTQEKLETIQSEMKVIVQAIEQTNEMVRITDRANTEKLCDYFNTTWLQFTGRTMEEEYGYGWAEGVHPDDFDRCVEIFNLNFDQRKSFSMEYRLKNVDQEYHWILDIGRPYYDLDGTFLGYIGSCYDITKQKNTQEKLETIQSEMKVIVQAIEQTNEMVRITDKDSIITYVNDAVVRGTGYTKEELVGQKSSIFKSAEHDESFYKNLWDTVLSGNIYNNVMINKKKDGTLYHEEQTITPVFDDQNNLSFVATSHDISKRIEIEKELHSLATEDTLRGVYNRYSINKEIDINIKKYELCEDIFSLLMLDIDHFKNVNDTYGHDMGDFVLKELCSAIKNMIRKTDTFGRWGGEEFLLILPNTNKDEAISIATKIRNIIENHKFDYIPQVTISIGVSVYNEKSRKEIFLKKVDDALYKAKSSGRNCVEYK